MTTVYTNQDKYSGQTSITYGEAGKTYGEIGYMYSGKLITLFTDENKNNSTYSSSSKSTATYSNQTKN